MISGALATFWVAVGGAIGSVGRYWLAIWVARFAGNEFPWGTLLINIIGSFVITYFGTLAAPWGLRPGAVQMRLFVMVGLCGGFTTFSSFSQQTLELLRAGENLRAFAYILASVVICLAASALGYYLATLGLASPTRGQS